MVLYKKSSVYFCFFFIKHHVLVSLLLLSNAWHPARKLRLAHVWNKWVIHCRNAENEIGLRKFRSELPVFMHWKFQVNLKKQIKPLAIRILQRLSKKLEGSNQRRAFFQWRDQYRQFTAAETKQQKDQFRVSRIQRIFVRKEIGNLKSYWCVWKTKVVSMTILKYKQLTALASVRTLALCSHWPTTLKMLFFRLWKHKVVAITSLCNVILNNRKMLQKVGHLIRRTLTKAYFTRMRRAVAHANHQKKSFFRALHLGRRVKLSNTFELWSSRVKQESNSILRAIYTLTGLLCRKKSIAVCKSFVRWKALLRIFRQLIHSDHIFRIAQTLKVFEKCVMKFKIRLQRLYFQKLSRHFIYYNRTAKMARVLYKHALQLKFCSMSIMGFGFTQWKLYIWCQALNSVQLSQALHAIVRTKQAASSVFIRKCFNTWRKSNEQQNMHMSRITFLQNRMLGAFLVKRSLVFKLFSRWKLRCVHAAHLDSIIRNLFVSLKWKLQQRKRQALHMWKNKVENCEIVECLKLKHSAVLKLSQALHAIVRTKQAASSVFIRKCFNTWRKSNEQQNIRMSRITIVLDRMRARMYPWQVRFYFSIWASHSKFHSKTRRAVQIVQKKIVRFSFEIWMRTNLRRRNHKFGAVAVLRFFVKRSHSIVFKLFSRWKLRCVHAAHLDSIIRNLFVSLKWKLQQRKRQALHMWKNKVENCEIVECLKLKHSAVLKSSLEKCAAKHLEDVAEKMQTLMSKHKDENRGLREMISNLEKWVAKHHEDVAYLQLKNSQYNSAKSSLAKTAGSLQDENMVIKAERDSWKSRCELNSAKLQASTFQVQKYIRLLNGKRKSEAIRKDKENVRQACAIMSSSNYAHRSRSYNMHTQGSQTDVIQNTKSGNREWIKAHKNCFPTNLKPLLECGNQIENSPCKFSDCALRICDITTEL
jgi:hypothetical protein